MGFLSHLFYPWGFLLQGLAIVHFIRRRPDTYWLYIILFLGPVGAAAYIFVEVLPDLGLLRESFKVFPRRKRIGALELAIRDNPSAGNWEELGDLYMDDGKLQQAEIRLREGHRRPLHHHRHLLPARRLRPLAGRCRCRLARP